MSQLATKRAIERQPRLSVSDPLFLIERAGFGISHGFAAASRLRKGGLSSVRHPHPHPFGVRRGIRDVTLVPVPPFVGATLRIAFWSPPNSPPSLPFTILPASSKMQTLVSLTDKPGKWPMLCFSF